MHVLFVSNHWGVKNKVEHGGIFVDRQIQALRNAAVRVSTFDVGTSYSPLKLLGKLRQLRRTAIQEQVEIVHARYGTVVAMLSVMSGFPTVITFGGSDLLPGASVSLIRTWSGIVLSNIASLFAKRNITVSEEMRDAMWFRSRKTLVIPDGVDMNLFKAGDQAQARMELGWDVGAPIIIIDSARDPENKGLPLAQEAVSLVRRAIPSVLFQVIQGISPDMMPLCYQAADVLLVTSRQEGSPNVVKEALACNLPVVAVPVGDTEERLSGVVPSAIVPKEKRAIAQALTGILRTRKRSNGREKVKDVSMDAVVIRMLEVYQSVIRQDAIC